MHRRSLLLFAAGALACAAPAHAGEHEHKKGGGVSYHQFPTLTAVVLRPDGRRGILTAEAGVDVPDGGLREKVQLLEPRLMDAFASALRKYGASLRPGATPDLDQLQLLLQAQTDRVLGARGARVLLGTVLSN